MCYLCYLYYLCYLWYLWYLCMADHHMQVKPAADGCWQPITTQEPLSSLLSSSSSSALSCLQTMMMNKAQHRDLLDLLLPNLGGWEWTALTLGTWWVGGWYKCNDSPWIESLSSLQPEDGDHPMINDFHEDEDDDQRCTPVSFAARMVQNAPISIPWWQCEHNATTSITLKTLSITVAINNWQYWFPCTQLI